MNSKPEKKTQGPEDTKKQRIKVQKPALPKGGGALTGLGESFTTHEFSGTFGLSLPLPVAPGRGSAPQLQASYESGSGNSILGMGWNLSTSSISRKTSRGIPRYDDTDNFLLDGAQLVRSQKAPSQRTIAGNTFTITQYLPQLEEEFERIEYCLSEAGGVAQAFWRVLSPDGTIHSYGQSAQARICDPSDPARIFEWLLEDVFDTHGNRQHYCYKQEAYTVMLGSPQFEHNRSHTANRYLERVHYGNRAPSFTTEGGLLPTPLPECLFETVLDYGEYDLTPTNDNPYAPTSAWLERSDPFSTWSAGFERRYHRLLRNVLLFHKFPDEWGPVPALTQILRFAYDESPAGSQLMQVTETHSRFNPKAPSGQRYAFKSLPPLDVAYTPFNPLTGKFELLKTAEGSVLTGFENDGFSAADLTGQGIASILYSDGKTIFIREPKIDSQPPFSQSYGEAKNPLIFPIERDASHLLDIDGDGRPDFLRTQSPAGYYPNSADGWQAFREFEGFPTDYAHSLNEHVDLEGSGFSGLAQVGPLGVRYYPGLGEKGFGPLVQNEVPPNNLPFSTDSAPDQIIRFTDLFGTGGSHRVKIESGKITCWPHLGYGRFGQAIELEHAPVWPDGMDASCVFLADIDGSGTQDLIFMEPQCVKIYRNLSGNAFSQTPLVLALPIACNAPNQLHFFDVYGRGAECLVVCDDSATPCFWCYDFCQGSKPYLLNQLVNNQGTETVIAYQSSTFYYLLDKNAGQPWVTNVPFPVAVVSSIESRDLISKTKNIASFAYHHGFYDSIEREFRGFGMVERSDTEALVPGSNLPNASTPITVAPLLTKTWYHPGVWGATENSLLMRYQQEFFTRDQNTCPIPQTWHENFPDVPNVENLRQAGMVMHGAVLRQEVYSLDNGSSRIAPAALYEISDHAFTVRLLQTCDSDHPYGSFLVYTRETLAYHYEWLLLNPQIGPDPKVVHEMTLEVDAWGNVTKACTLGYARRNPDSSDCLLEQKQIMGHGHETLCFNPREEIDLLILGVAREEKEFELLDLPQPDLLDKYFSFAAIKKYYAPEHCCLLAWSRHFFRMEPDHLQLLPQLLLLRSENAVFSTNFIKSIFQATPVAGKLDTLLSQQGGYVLDETTGYWWNPGATQEYFTAAENFFFLPKSVTDPFGACTTYAYDAYGLFVKSLTTHAANILDAVTRVEAIDYQALAPLRLQDENHNIQEVLLDVDGTPLASSHYRLYGQPGQEGFTPLEQYTPQSSATLDAIVANPAAYLQGAAEFFYHDPFAWIVRQKPCATITLTVDQYPSSAEPTKPGGRVHIQIGYADGFGRAVQTKALVEGGQAFLCDSQGNPILTPDKKSVEEGHVDTRWLSTGGTQYNNKGLPFRQYEPYYISAYQYTDFEYLARLGISPTIWYDGQGRVVRTDLPRGPFKDCGVFERTEYLAWSTAHFDANDTLTDSPYYAFILQQASPDPWEKAALLKAAACYNTPAVQIINVRNDVIREIHYLDEKTPLASTRVYDAAGHETSCLDPLNLVVYQYRRALTGEALQTINVDSGTHYSLTNIWGQTILSYDSRKHLITFTFDALHRPISTHVEGGDSKLCLDHTTERIVYGDALDTLGHLPLENPDQKNMCGRIFRHYHPAGLQEIVGYTLLGAPTLIQEHLRTQYQAEANWNVAWPNTWDAFFKTCDSLLDPGPYTTTNQHDAFGRMIKSTIPINHCQEVTYLLSGQVEEVRLDGKPYFNCTDYNPKGQRLKATQAGVLTHEYQYAPDTYRLKTMTSFASDRSAPLQNLAYSYDPIGNITHTTNPSAPGRRVFNRNQEVTADSDFTYDPLYRLVASSGRAHMSFSLQDDRTGTYQPFFKTGRSVLNNSQDVETYSRTYDYDSADNLLNITHLSALPWSRALTLVPGTHRAVYLPEGSGRKAEECFDPCGNQLWIDGLAGITWNYRDNIQNAALVTRQKGDPDAEYYVYDHTGHRVRKVSETLVNGQIQRDETIYLGASERFTQTLGDKVIEDRWRIRVMDGNECIAEYLEWIVRPRPETPTMQTRLQISNHLGSSVMETDEQGKMISYEEYAPYGSTVYATGESLAQVSLKQYRYSGQERDKLTGLYYYGMRYYAPWAARWLSPDPAGEIDGLNLYAFVGGNPVNHVDINGLGKKKPGKRKRKRKSSDGPTGEPKSRNKIKSFGNGNLAKIRAVADGAKPTAPINAENIKKLTAKDDGKTYNYKANAIRIKWKGTYNSSGLSSGVTPFITKRDSAAWSTEHKDVRNKLATHLKGQGITPFGKKQTYAENSHLLAGSMYGPNDEASAPPASVHQNTEWLAIEEGIKSLVNSKLEVRTKATGYVFASGDHKGALKAARYKIYLKNASNKWVKVFDHLTDGLRGNIDKSEVSALRTKVSDLNAASSEERLHSGKTPKGIGGDSPTLKQVQSGSTSSATNKLFSGIELLNGTLHAAQAALDWVQSNLFGMTVAMSTS